MIGQYRADYQASETAVDHALPMCQYGALAYEHAEREVRRQLIQPTCRSPGTSRHSLAAHPEGPRHPRREQARARGRSAAVARMSPPSCMGPP
jgi:hypothetical protein